MKRFLCALFGHATPPGITRAMSIYFRCDRCCLVVPGGFVASRRKPTSLAMKGNNR